ITHSRSSTHARGVPDELIPKILSVPRPVRGRRPPVANFWKPKSRPTRPPAYPPGDIILGCARWETLSLCTRCCTVTVTVLPVMLLILLCTPAAVPLSLTLTPALVPVIPSIAP